jgi:hypothetical protein
MAEKTKMTLALATREIIRQRAAEDGLDMGSYIDRLVERDDLRRRIAADVTTLETARLGRRTDAIAAAAVRSRHAAL